MAKEVTNMSVFLDDFIEFMKTQPFEIIRFSCVEGDGEIETRECIKTSRCQNAYSVAKTFTMFAIGLLYDRGLLKLSDRICDIFSDELPECMDRRWYDCTVEMALTHSLGLPVGFLDIDVAKYSDFGNDFLKYTLGYPLEYDPGTRHMYSDGAYYLLARIAEKKSGMPLDLFLRRTFPAEIDLQEIAWSRCPQGHVMGATGLYIHSSDMVKLGMILRDKGRYRGISVLSEEWVDLVLRNGFAVDWDDEHRFFCKGGMYGQKLMVFPEQNRVAAVQSSDGNSEVIAQWIKNYRER